MGDQAGSGEGVVLVPSDQVPGEYGHLPGGRDDGGPEAATRLDPLEEGPQGPRCAPG